MGDEAGFLLVLGVVVILLALDLARVPGFHGLILEPEEESLEENPD